VTATGEPGLADSLPAVVRRRLSPTTALLILGLASLIPYAYALRQANLRLQHAELAVSVLAALLFYIPAVIVVVRDDRPTSLRRLLLIVGFAIAFRLIMVFTQPVLSDDMYRYVWDGRVQAHGINPYALPPGAPELSALRDDTIWPLINRKWAVTIYPAATQIAFAALWRIRPDSVRWFQIAMTGGTIVAGILLMALAKALGRPAGRALIFLWSPAVVFETAHSAHVDGLVLIFIVAAWLARSKGRDGWTGIWLGVATAMKLLPVMLAPALWRPRDEGERRRATWTMPLAVVAVFAITYVPYLSLGKEVIGYLPIYFTERGSASPHALLGQISPALRVPEGPLGDLALVLTLATISLFFVLRPAQSGEQAIRRCIWPLVALALLTQYLLPWYLLPIVPLCALFVRAGRMGLKPDGWALLLLITSASTLGYAFLPV
jgi:alpha-1,6-mannosyltransferase